MSDNVETRIHFDDPSLTKKYTPLVAQIGVDNYYDVLQRNSTVPKNNIFQRNNKAKAPRLKAPYRKRELDRFEDTYRCDGVVRNLINKKWYFMLGAHISVSLDVNREFQNNEERGIQIQKVMSYEPYIKAMNCANEVLRKTNFRKIIHAAGVQASTYGRSCVEVVWNDTPDGLPVIRFNVLNSKLLGDVEVNKDTWEFLGVHYRDLPRSDDLLEAENIIYITRHDVHMSPGSMYYGLSDLEPVIDGSETKRIIKQQDLKEMSRTSWGGFGWIKFKNPNVTKAQIKEIIESMKAGAWTGTDQDVEIEVKQIAQSAPILLEIIDSMNLESARDLEVPSPLAGYENKQNYSNLVQTLIAWKESSLDAERKWISEIVQTQLLDKIFRRELEKQGIQLPYSDYEDIIVQQTEQIPNSQPLNPLQPNGMIVNTPQVIPPAKLVLDITDPNFAPHKERVESAIALFNIDLISARKVLQEAGMEEETEETEARLRAKELQAQQMQQFQQNVFANQVQATDELTNRKRNILVNLENKLAELKGGSGEGNGKGSRNPQTPKNKFGLQKPDY